VDLSLAVVDVCDALAPLLKEEGVEIATRLLDRGAAVITGERDQIVQVAQNLIANAAK
jgi:two-component system phosphate regulon sensor histidine kinase PhoR